ncbi:toxin-antitoxin system YwqK family antitoxin [Flavobacterium psychrophilum]|uniref:toxin-antitoxin system YwqK family antitoxin n=1 Tax=Flavobacterium psychrophilum TaxID=96345 RepID=UPI0029B6F762|nr:toxin-antitoxin system YwqK family antitoxin [Flavobacterium psychrophilum]ELY2018706.1 toxin-antitoxin system YwqK family antitoxin [Flavobacterium psychrophilum]MEB3380440.1 toxin-antitoxin system YwqK family antitoxin [Flavobacterium psychrophilum]
MTRKLIIIFTFILIYGCHNADINDSSKRNENWVYWIDKKTGEASWVPVTDNETTLKDGRYTRFYTSGGIYQKGKLKNGKDIDTLYFYDLKEKLIQYLLVKPDTLLHYYLRNGPYISYSQNGKIFEKGIIENHQIGDEWTKYFDNGKIDWTKKLVNGTGWNYWYYKNGQMSDSNYHVNGKTDGEVKIWFENGQIKEISNWKEGIQDGMYQTYYENGQPKEKVNWINDKRDGKSERWYENGQKEEEMYFKAGIEDGEVLQWHPNGNRKAILKFISGQVDGKGTTYFENGKIKAEGFYKDGKRNGMFIEYDKNGKIIKKINHINGEPVE